MINFINYTSTILSGIKIKEVHLYKKEYLNDICIKFFGDIKTSKNVFICLHGMGGTKESRYITYLSNSLINEFGKDLSFITYDMPGVGESVKSQNFWGIQQHLVDVYIDDIIEWILKQNKDISIFIAGFSASANSLIYYLTDDGYSVKNKLKDKITHSILVSPTGDAIETLEWIDKFSLFAMYIATYHTYSQINYLLKNFKLIEFFNFLKEGKFLIFKSALISNTLLSGNNKYKINFNCNIKNCDIILSKYDPITNYDITMKLLNNLNNLNYIECNLGGHVGIIIQQKVKNHIINLINEKNNLKKNKKIDEQTIVEEYINQEY